MVLTNFLPQAYTRSMDRDELVTEARAAEGVDLDLRSTRELVELMNREDSSVPPAVAAVVWWAPVWPPPWWPPVFPTPPPPPPVWPPLC